MDIDQIVAFSERLDNMNPRQRRGLLDSFYAGLKQGGYENLTAQAFPEARKLLEKHGMLDHAEKLAKVYKGAIDVSWNLQGFLPYTDTIHERLVETMRDQSHKVVEVNGNVGGFRPSPLGKRVEPSQVATILLEDIGYDCKISRIPISRGTVTYPAGERIKLLGLGVEGWAGGPDHHANLGYLVLARQ